MDKLLDLVKLVNGYLTDYILIFLLVGVGIYFTIRTRFVQVRCFGEGMKKVFGNIKLFGGKNKGGMSSFQALATAIAAQVGTGNIVGASGAILLDGPGAIFWMWVIAFFGMATIYAEAVLAQQTRVKGENGEIFGGPVYYIKKAFKGGFGKFLAVFFSIAAILALGFMGSMVQSNSIADSVTNAVTAATGFTASWIPWVVGAIVALLAAVIFVGGVNRIAAVTEKLVPVMACLFLLGGVVILAINIKDLPATFGMIFKYAFTPQAIIAGGIGAALKAAVSQGAKRGLFSNEAGMGSTPHAHALANVKNPHDQGVVAMIGVFIDTFVVLTMTALVVISSMYCGDGILADKLTSVDNVYGIAVNGEFNEAGEKIADAIVSKTTIMQESFTETLPEFFGSFGSIFVAICLFFFAFSTIVSWNLFGKLNVQSLFKNKKWAVISYAVISVAFIFLGSILKNDLVWELTDFFNYLMVLPNAIALFALGKFVADEAKRAKEAKKASKK